MQIGSGRSRAHDESTSRARTARAPAFAANVAIAVAVAALSLTGCAGVGPSSGQTEAAPSTAGTVAPSTDPSATPSVTDAPPALMPDGSADENKSVFDAVSGGVFDVTPDAGGRAVVDALVAAGFTKADMEVTEDRTAIGDPVGSLQFSVRFGDACIVGERSPGGYTSIVAPALGTGRCLVGATRAIDW